MRKSMDNDAQRWHRSNDSSSFFEKLPPVLHPYSRIVIFPRAIEYSLVVGSLLSKIAFLKDLEVVTLMTRNHIDQPRGS